MKNIEGVKLKNLKVIPDERGWLMEILRCDEEIFDKFGQVYITTAYPGVVKGWHYHKIQTDNFTCIRGMMKVVLYDSREDSPTYGNIMELFVGRRILYWSVYLHLCITALRGLNRNSIFPECSNRTL